MHLKLEISLIASISFQCTCRTEQLHGRVKIAHFPQLDVNHSFVNKCQQSAIKHCYLGPQDTHPHPIRRSISNRRFLSARQRHRSFSFQANSRDLLLRATRARGPTPRSAIDFWWEHNADLFTGQSETFLKKYQSAKLRTSRATRLTRQFNDLICIF